MGDTLISGKEFGVKDSSGVGTSEMTRLGGWVEYLEASSFVNREIVDRFVITRTILVGCVVGLREHGHNCFGVWFCQLFSLESVLAKDAFLKKIGRVIHREVLFREARMLKFVTM